MKIDLLKSFNNKLTLLSSYSNWAFTLLFILCSIVYNYDEILFKPPQSIHQWRQADCLSITMNYYQDDNAFLEPGVHNLGNNGTGKTISTLSYQQDWQV